MRKSSVVVAVVIGMLATAGSAFALPHSSATGLSHRSVCGAVVRGFARCDADVVTDKNGAPFDGKVRLNGTSPPPGLERDVRSSTPRRRSMGFRFELPMVDRGGDRLASGRVVQLPHDAVHLGRGLELSGAARRTARRADADL